MEAQKKFNIILVCILALAMIIMVACGYFNYLSNVAMVFHLIAACSIAGIAILEVYKYQDILNHNPFKFWGWTAAIAGVFLVAMSTLGVSELLPDRLNKFLFMGFAGFIAPLLGSCIGWITRKIVDTIVDWRWHFMWTRKRV